MIAADIAVAACGAALAPHGALVTTVILGWTLALLACIDVLALRLPDLITLPLMVAGLLLGPPLLATPFDDRLIGAAVGYGVIAALGWTFARLRGREGIGLGDAKLLGAAGAWLGWQALPSVLLIGCLIAFAWIAVTRLRRRAPDPAAPLAFGAPLALATWIVWLHGPLVV